jgi:ATP phosphoribosyltransferase regulatory subunit
MIPKAFEKPIGFQDVPPTLTLKKRELEHRLTTTFSSWGYQEVMTPMVEYAETVGKASAIAEEKMLKLIGQEGSMLVLRPDQTAPIARMVNSLLQQEPLPLRLFYHASVFRTQEQAAGRRAESYQSGIELIGEESPSADAEVLALAITALQACQSTSFRLVIGHVSLLAGLLEHITSQEGQRLELIQYLSVRDYVGFEQLIQKMEVKEKGTELLYLLRGITNKEALLPLLSHPSDKVVKAATQLQHIWGILADYGYDSLISVDIRLLGNLDYYTGIYIEGYAEGVGFPILSGGRYDELYEQFGRVLPATGFAFRMNNLLSTCSVILPSYPSIILSYPSDMQKGAIEKASQLREAGQIVTLQVDESQTGIVLLQKEAKGWSS